METIEALTTRRSVRQFQDREVPRDLLVQGLAAAAQAPTARNEQPWEFIVVTGAEVRGGLAAFADHGKFISGAPVCIAVVCRDTKYYLEDGAAAVVNLLNALHALGLGACWVAGDKKPYAGAVLARLGVPEGYKLIALVPCGYAASVPKAPLKRELAALLHWERF
jgi:nitroreductase